MKELGANETIDYRGEGVGEVILEKAGEEGVRFVIDCIGSLEGSVRPISRVVKAPGTIVAIMLPVVVRDTTDPEGPSYSMDVKKGVGWAEGVIVKGVRTHFYMQVSLFPFSLFSFLWFGCGFAILLTLSRIGILRIICRVISFRLC